ncbi:MAG: flagellar FliJ family protein [Phycisphaerales bacterium]|nr:flagellar FliJ family protein [Phycisphaerales bacterium]
MRGFRFRLDPVLEQRRRIEEQQQLAVAEVERERLALEERIRAYARAIAQEQDDLRRQLTLGGDLRAARLQANASLDLTNKANRAVLELAGVHKRLDAARIRLLEAMTRRKAMEVLRDRAEQAYREEQKRRAAAELDELVVMRHGRAGTADLESKP